MDSQWCHGKGLTGAPLRKRIRAPELDVVALGDGGGLGDPVLALTG
jgi:hypothetical protein